ncbi:IS3 family transposase [Lactobacillus sp. IBH004]|uniref:IS3 family transposase n=1 Tax=Lactobacillus sp. IBH004 TaxID=2879107 RepID=UPI002243F77B|nr:IS3 family transposase [Lactobacillus sp. IBH004]UZN41181.1 IS3 family transposase [Lactobacillus sp. IBH004]
MHYSFLAKSTYEYHPRSRRKKYSDLALLSLIKVVKRHNPSFGYLPMTDTLKIKYGLQVNHKRIYRLMKEHKLLTANTTCVQASMIHQRSARQEGEEPLPPEV